MNLIQRFVDKICGKFLCHRYGNWNTILNDYEVIIVYVQKNSAALLEYICARKQPFSACNCLVLEFYKNNSDAFYNRIKNKDLKTARFSYKEKREFLFKL